MLILSRKVGQEIFVGDGIRIVINRISGNRVSLGITAPGDVSIRRGELPQFEDGSASSGELPAEVLSQVIFHLDTDASCTSPRPR